MSISFQDLKQQPIVTSSTKKNTVQTNTNRSVTTPKAEKNRDSHKLLLALGGLAVLGSGALLVYNSLKRGKIASANNYSLERIDKFIKRLPKELKMSWQNRIKRLPLDKAEFVKALVNKKQDILPLEYLFKLKELLPISYTDIIKEVAIKVKKEAFIAKVLPKQDFFSFVPMSMKDIVFSSVLGKKIKICMLIAKFGFYNISMKLSVFINAK